MPDQKINIFPLDLGNGLLAGFFGAFFDRSMPQSLPHIFVREEEVRLNLNKWFTNLAIIHAALDDAEEKQWTNVAVKMWLDDLRDFFYDLEDMLDEYDTKLLARSLTAPSWNNFIPTAIEVVKDLVTNAKAMSDSGRLYKRLEELCDRRNLLGLIQRTTGGTSTAAWQRPPSTCLPTETVVYGRDEDIRKIFDMINSRDANFHVISIVGMAGVGKTTLAQTVYNCCEETDFNLKAWVCVSDDFDAFRISMAILESLTGSPCHLNNLNEVQVQLRQVVKDSKFLLVLDDVWSESYDSWERLRSPFAAGAQGSIIIVTTRSVDVALTIGGPSGCYHLKLLSDEDCWRVFEKHVRENRDVGAYPNLESFREKVVRKCEGLPLAARTHGGLLRFKESSNEWNGVLNSKIWELPKESNILPVLKLSYYHLPTHLKRCFAHCAILPKKYEFEEKELVRLWVVEGLIKPSESNKHKQLEDIGHEYFQDLLSRSIFQKSSGDASTFVMHNLINDLAQWVSGETSFKLEDKLETDQHLRKIHRARHSSYICGQFDHKSKFEVFDEVRHLRTFLPVLTQNVDCYISDAVLQDLHKFKKLRVLSLQRYRITNLPLDFNKHLRYLRYLNLGDSKIESLPGSITLLYNLQILILRNCSRLLKLPYDVRTLINLRHLDIKGATRISEMPLGMQELKKIQTLSDFIVSNSSSSSSSGHLKHLKNLKFLRGELRISQLQNLPELLEAILSDKEKLQVLILEWGSEFNSRNEEKEKDVLDMLQPHKNLKQITIRHYGGSAFPSWVGDPCFSNIAVLRLEDCKNCTSLPPLGLLGSLKDLTITGMKKLENIGMEFCGNGCSKPFRALEILRLENLDRWQDWNSVENNGRDIFGSLRELSIKACPEVRGSLPKHLPKLQKLVIQQCKRLEILFSSIPDLCEVEMDGCRNMGRDNAANFDLLKFMSLSNVSISETWFRRTFQKVEHLKINSCSDYILRALQSCSLTHLRELEMENCTTPVLMSLELIRRNSVCLDCLKIKDCQRLKFIVRGQLLSTLKKLKIHNCQNLRCVLEADDPSSQIPKSIDHNKPSLLEHLCISECQSLTTLSSSGQLPEALRRLKIQDCWNLTTLGQLPEKLEQLEIKKCSALTSLSGDKLPASLKHLHIEECPMITLLSISPLPASLERLNIKFCLQLPTFTSVAGPLPQGLKQLKINSCGISSIHDGLPNLSNLQELDISNCPSLVSFPEGGLPSSSLTILSISCCVNLQALPISMHSLTSLQELHISRCVRITALPNGGFPTRITSLSIENHQIYSLLTQWGLYKLTSLRKLRIVGCPDALSIPTEGMEMMFPPSLTHLTLIRFPKLRRLSSGFTSLTSLEYLWISYCRELASFPQEGLPPSLLELHIFGCPRLTIYCGRESGREWRNIVDIPFIEIGD